MYPWETFHFCPKCGTKSESPPEIRFECPACQFVFYFNPAIGVAAIVTRPDGRILMLKRQRDPHQSKLGIPGGFVDHGEAVDDALRREIREETGLEIAQSELEYLAAYPNEYTYAGLTYQISDVFYIARAQSFDSIKRQEGEVAELIIIAPSEVNLDDMAFESNRQALRDYLKRIA